MNEMLYLWHRNEYERTVGIMQDKYATGDRATAEDAVSYAIIVTLERYTERIERAPNDRVVVRCKADGTTRPLTALVIKIARHHISRNRLARRREIGDGLLAILDLIPPPDAVIEGQGVDGHRQRQIQTIDRCCREWVMQIVNVNHRIGAACWLDDILIPPRRLTEWTGVAETAAIHNWLWMDRDEQSQARFKGKEKFIKFALAVLGDDGIRQ